MASHRLWRMKSTQKFSRVDAFRAPNNRVEYATCVDKGEQTLNIANSQPSHESLGTTLNHSA